MESANEVEKRSCIEDGGEDVRRSNGQWRTDAGIKNVRVPTALPGILANTDAKKWRGLDAVAVPALERARLGTRLVMS